MTVTINGSKLFMGMPLRVARDILKAWRFGNRDPMRIGALSAIGENPDTVIAVLAELEECGFIGDEEDEDVSPFPKERVFRGLTLEGRALASASARKRMARKKAEKVVNDLIERAGMINGDSELPKHIERIWLFGSIIDPGKPDVGDIDIVVETRIADRFSHMDIIELEEWVRRRYVDELPLSIPWYVDSAIGRITNKRLYGGRRPSIIAPNDIGTLAAMHVPCRLVFDASRGGRVDDPVLQYHPASQGRSSHIRQKLALAKVDPGNAMRPSDARFLMDGRYPFDFPDRWSFEAVPFPERLQWRYNSSGDRFYHDGHILASTDDVTRYVKGMRVPAMIEAQLRLLDGKERSAILFAGRHDHRRPEPRAGILLKRTIIQGKDIWRVACEIDAFGDRGLAKREVEWAKDAIMVLAAADARRLMSRRAKEGRNARIEITFDAHKEDHEAQGLLSRFDEVVRMGGFIMTPEDGNEEAPWVFLAGGHVTALKLMASRATANLDARQSVDE